MNKNKKITNYLYKRKNSLRLGMSHYLFGIACNKK